MGRKRREGANSVTGVLREAGEEEVGGAFEVLIQALPFLREWLQDGGGRGLGYLPTQVESGHGRRQGC